MEQIWIQGTVERWKVRAMTVVAARTGRFWFTRRGDSQDYLLVGGEAVTLPRGPWVVQALQTGTLVRTDRVARPQKIELGRREDEARRLSAVSGI